MSIKRRAFLGGSAAGVGLFALRPQQEGPATDGVVVRPSADAPVDPDVARIVALSRDGTGAPHIDRVAFVAPERITGTLPLSDEEADELRAVLAARDFTPFQQRGLRVDGKKFVFIREMDGGTVVHAVRRGEFVTVRAMGDQLVVATSVDGMAHPRAVEAVYQFVRREAGIA